MSKTLFCVPSEREDFNTNNAWGFGGGIGVRYTMCEGKVIVRTGRAYYRHAPSTPFTVVYVDNKRFIDVAQSLNTKIIDRVNEIIMKLKPNETTNTEGSEGRD
jgi:hypothetical protein